MALQHEQLNPENLLLISNVALSIICLALLAWLYKTIAKTETKADAKAKLDLAYRDQAEKLWRDRSINDLSMLDKLLHEVNDQTNAYNSKLKNMEQIKRKTVLADRIFQEINNLSPEGFEKWRSIRQSQMQEFSTLANTGDLSPLQDLTAKEVPLKNSLSQIQSMVQSLKSRWSDPQTENSDQAISRDNAIRDNLESSLEKSRAQRAEIEAELAIVKRNEAKLKSELEHAKARANHAEADLNRVESNLKKELSNLREDYESIKKVYSRMIAEKEFIENAYINEAS